MSPCLGPSKSHGHWCHRSPRCSDTSTEHGRVSRPQILMGRLLVQGQGAFMARQAAASCHVPPTIGWSLHPGGGDSVFWPIRAWKRCRALAFWVSAVANCARGARWRLQPGGVTCLGITKGMGRNGGWWPGARAELGGEWGTPQPGCCPGAGWIWGRTGQEVLCGGRGHPGSCTPLGERPATIPIPPGVQSPPKWGPFPSTSGSLEGQRPRERARNVPQLCNHTTLHLGGNFFTFWLNCGR